MTDKNFGLLSIGNALVDILAPVGDSYFAGKNMKKGEMRLIDRGQAQSLANDMKGARAMPGGSAANSACVFSSFGGQAAFIGKVAPDAYGSVFTAGLGQEQVAYSGLMIPGDEETGRSYVLVTPDGERTMNTYLGINGDFGPRDIDESLIAKSGIVLMEGYLYDKPVAKAAFNKAAALARQAGAKVAFTLSDQGCVQRHHADFTALVRDHVDILFGNEREIKALALKDDFEEAAKDIAGHCEYVVATRGSRGALILQHGQAHAIASVKPARMVDTTGAGDAFAGAVLFGLHAGMDPARAGTLGARAASATISHLGARSPQQRFSDFLAG